MVLSPHVSIYKFPMAALSSITNRITGIVLSGCFGAGGLVCLFGQENQLIDAYSQLCPNSKRAVHGIVTFPVAFHTLGGIRHFLWDAYPKLLTNKSVAKSSVMIFVGSAMCSGVVSVLT